jgi:hypothetical protein
MFRHFNLFPVDLIMGDPTCCCLEWGGRLYREVMALLEPGGVALVAVCGQA